MQSAARIALPVGCFPTLCASADVKHHGNPGTARERPTADRTGHRVDPCQLVVPGEDHDAECRLT